MRDLESQTDAELLSTIGQAHAILSRRQRERGLEFQRAMVAIEGRYNLTDLKNARALQLSPHPDTLTKAGGPTDA